MPVRVKCRCGQELVLRYGEWVYFLLGLVLLCLVVNSAALLLLYFRLDEASGRSPAPTTASVAGPRPEETPEESPGGNPSRPEPAAATAATGRPPATERAPAPPAPARPADAAPGGSDAGERREEAQPVRPPEERKAPASVRAPGDFPATDPDVASILSILPPWREGEPRERVRTVEPDVPAAPWSKEAAVVRFLVLERAPREGLLRHAFLLDPDRRLRRAAVDRLGSQPAPAGDDAALARRILEAAAPFLDEEPGRAAVFRAHGLEAGKTEGSRGPDLERILGSLEGRAASMLSDPAMANVRSFIAKVAEKGMDIVFLIDVTRSMEGVLEPLQRDSLWLFPAIRWTFPGARIGVVLYRDGVEAVEGFAGTDSKDLARVLQEARAEGGGDVPEGVHRAIEQALALGRFAWRPSAEKHIILIGDAPPPYQEMAPLTSLVGRAFREGNYRFHAVSIRPEDGRPAVPYFPEIARHGGGTAATVQEPARLAEELFWRLFPPEVVEAMRPFGGPLKSLFAGAGT